MPVKPSEQQIARLVAAYARHRSLIQRGLTVAFVFHVLSTTYNGLFAKPGVPAQGGKGKGKSKADDSIAFGPIGGCSMGLPWRLSELREGNAQSSFAAISPLSE